MAIGRVYIGAGQLTSFGATAPKTIFEVTSAAALVTTIERISITQETQDTSENVSMKLQRMSIAGTGSSTITCAKVSLGDSAFSGTVKSGPTAEGTYTASTVLYQAGYNVLSGFLWTPANDDEVFVIPPSGIVGCLHNTALASAATFDFEVTVREIG